MILVKWSFNALNLKTHLKRKRYLGQETYPILSVSNMESNYSLHFQTYVTLETPSSLFCTYAEKRTLIFSGTIFYFSLLYKVFEAIY